MSSPDRRRFIGAVVVGAFMPIVTLGQARPARIGMIGPLPREKSIVAAHALRALAQLGYVEGKGMTLEYRETGFVAARTPAVVHELLALNCEVVFAFVDESMLRALQERRSRTPVVFFSPDFDPVERGFIQNTRQPSGNMTGVYGPASAITAKRLELAQEVLPGAKRFLVFADVYSQDQLRALRTAAAARGAELTVVEYARPPYDLASGFETGRRAGVDAFIGLSTPHLAAKRVELGELFLKYRMPAIASRLSLAEPGFLVGYTFNLGKLLHRMAEMGVRILKGAKPSEIPIEEPHEFELLVNLKTAKILGVNIPYTVLARATKLIE